MIELDGTPEERLKDAVTSPYDISDSDLEALIVAIANQFEDIEETRQDVYESKFIDAAEGEQLAKLASIIPAFRLQQETTSEFRQRIKAELRSQLSSGTHDDVLKLTAVLLGIEDTETITIKEQSQTPKPSFSVDLPVTEVGERNLNTSALNPLLDEVSAVGVRPTSRLITPEATFTIRGGSTINPESILADNATFVTSVADTITYGKNVVDTQTITFTTGDTISGISTLSTVTTVDFNFGSAIHQTIDAKALSSSELEPLSQADWTLSNA